MAFDIKEFVKTHPYEVGAAAIVAGLVLFYLLSSSGSSAAGTSSSSNDESSVLAADSQLAQINAGTAQANSATAAQVQEASLAAQSQNYATQASLQENDTNTAAQLAATLYGIQASLGTTELNDQYQTVQDANQLIETQNTTSMQDAVLADQINSGILENANNNATALAGAQLTADTNNLAINSTLQLAQQQEADAYNLTAANNAAYNAEIPTIVSEAGEQKNSALDATDQTSIFQTILSKGASNVAGAGTAASASTAASGNAAATSQLGIGASLLQGLFG